jgi:Tfp pilus assembly protein PilO
VKARNRWVRHAVLLAAAGLLLLGNLGFFVWYRGTARDRKAGLEARRAALQRDVESSESEARKLAGQRERLSGVRTALDDFYGRRIGPRRETLAPVVDEIHAILKRLNISPGQIGYAVSSVANPPVTQMVISFSFKGDYGKLKQLLTAVQTDRKWLAVRQITLNRDQDLPGSVQVSLTLVTYFLGEEAEPKRASLPAGGAP